MACYLLATTATHLAVISQQACHARTALTLCRHTTQMLSAAHMPHPQSATPTAIGDHVGARSVQQQQQQQRKQLEGMQQQHMRVQLQCMMSQCQLHDRQSSAEQALASAKAAVQTASGCKNEQLVSAALQQLSRYAIHIKPIRSRSLLPLSCMSLHSKLCADCLRVTTFAAEYCGCNTSWLGCTTDQAYLSVTRCTLCQACEYV